MSRSAAPATPGRSSASATATSRATDAWNASGGTAAISVITTSATRSEYSAGSRIARERDLEDRVQAVRDDDRDADEEAGAEQAARGALDREDGLHLSLYSRLRRRAHVGDRPEVQARARANPRTEGSSAAYVARASVASDPDESKRKYETRS